MRVTGSDDVMWMPCLTAVTHQFSSPFFSTWAVVESADGWEHLPWAGKLLLAAVTCWTAVHGSDRRTVFVFTQRLTDYESVAV